MTKTQQEATDSNNKNNNSRSRMYATRGRPSFVVGLSLAVVFLVGAAAAATNNDHESSTAAMLPRTRTTLPEETTTRIEEDTIQYERDLRHHDNGDKHHNKQHRNFDTEDRKQKKEKVDKKHNKNEDEVGRAAHDGEQRKKHHEKEDEVGRAARDGEQHEKKHHKVQDDHRINNKDHHPGGGGRRHHRGEGKKQKKPRENGAKKVEEFEKPAAKGGGGQVGSYRGGGRVNGPRDNWLSEKIEPIPYQNCIPMGAAAAAVGEKKEKRGHNYNDQRQHQKKEKNHKKGHNIHDQRNLRGRSRNKPDLQGARKLKNNQMGVGQRQGMAARDGGGGLPLCPEYVEDPAADESNTHVEEEEDSGTITPTFTPTTMPNFAPSPSPSITSSPDSGSSGDDDSATSGDDDGTTSGDDDNVSVSSSMDSPSFGPTTPSAPEVVIPTNLSLAFASGVTPRLPTEDEIDGLMEQTSDFFEGTLTSLFPDLDEFDASFVSSALDETRLLPLELIFDSRFIFDEGTTAPSAFEIFTAIVNEANLTDFLVNYIWESGPQNSTIFADTAALSLNPLGPFPTASFAPVRAIAHRPSVGGNGKDKLLETVLPCYVRFRFSDKILPRVRTQEEIDGLLVQTSQFFTNLLDIFFPDFESFEASFVSREEDYASNLPVTVYFDGIAAFKEGSDVTPLDLFSVMAPADFVDYIFNYAWISEPFGKSIFFETLEVDFHAQLPGTTFRPLGKAVVARPQYHLPINVAQSPPRPPASDSTDGGGETVLIPSKIKFGFFDNVTPRQPTQEEIDGLTDATNRFYSDLISAIYANVDSVDVESMGSAFDDRSTLPVTVGFDVRVDFDEGTSIPTPVEIFLLMDAADYQEYIRNYARSSEPQGTSIFFYTSEVDYSARISDLPTTTPAPTVAGATNSPTAGGGFTFSPTARTIAPTIALTFAPTVPGATNSPTAGGGFTFYPTAGVTSAPTVPVATIAPTTGGVSTTAPTTPGATIAPTSAGLDTEVIVESVIDYGLFSGVTPREPTEEEIDGLIVETTRFYTDLLSDEYPNLEDFEAVFVCSSFDASNDLPIKIGFDAKAEFTEGSSIPTTAELFDVMESADYLDYIVNYVWFSEPSGTSIFFDTQEVTYSDRTEDCPLSTPSPTALGGTNAPTTGGFTTNAPTTGGFTTNSPTTIGGTNAPTTGGFTTNAPTTGGFTTNAPTTGGFTNAPTVAGFTIGPTTISFTTNAPTTTTRAPTIAVATIAPTTPGATIAPTIPGATIAPTNVPPSSGATNAPTTPGATIAPTNESPSSDDTLAPTVTGATIAPTSVAFDAEVVITSFIEYGFFDFVTPREPTQEEIDGLIVQTTRFYTDYLSDEYTYFASFDAVFVCSRFTVANELPILIGFDAVASFTGDPSPPSKEEMFDVLERADYERYITDYVWNSEPTSTIFFNTQQVAYNERGSDDCPSGTPSPTASSDDTLAPTRAGDTIAPTIPGATIAPTNVRFTPGPTGTTSTPGPTAFIYLTPGPTSTIGTPGPTGTTFTPLPTATTATPGPTGTTIPPTNESPSSDDTLAPTVTGVTVAPTISATEVIVESAIEYGLFAGVTVREPTQEELDGLIVETTRFYTDLLRVEYTNFDSFEAVFVCSSFEASNDLPIKIVFDAKAVFTEGYTIPTTDELFDVMESADYFVYITEYVWFSEPTGTSIFFDTQEVAYNERESGDCPSAAPSPTFTPTFTSATTSPTSPSSDDDLTTAPSSPVRIPMPPALPPFLAPIISPQLPSIAPILPPVDAPSVAPALPPFLAPIIAPTVDTPSIAPALAPILPPVDLPSIAPALAPIIPPLPPAVAPAIAPIIPPLPPVIAPVIAPIFDRTSAPTITGGTTISPTASGATAVTVESRLEFGFFDGVTPRPPTQEEIDGLIVQTERFYTDLLSSEYEDFVSFEAVVLCVVFNETSTFPVLIDFDAVSYFAEGGDVPSESEVFDVMEAANYQDYIINYVWNSEPVGESIFFDTQRGSYNEREELSSECLGESPTTSPSSTSSSGLVVVESQMEFHFFDSVTPKRRLPTSEEIDGLMVQTSRFYTDTLQSAYSNLATFEAVFVARSFDSTKEFPVKVDFDANALFAGGESIPTTEEVFAVMEAADYEDYIIKYVWNSLPLFSSIFFWTEEVAFNARLPAPGLPTASPVPTEIPTAQPSGGVPTLPEPTTATPTILVTPLPTMALTASGIETVVVESTMKFRLFDGIEPRPPTMEEIRGLLNQTSRFYTDVLSEAYPVKFYDFDASFVGEEFDSEGDYPIKIDFDANAVFEFTSLDPSIPSAYDVFLVMESADYLEYITDYVWLSEPVGESIFWEVQAVQYCSRDFTIAPTGSTTATLPPTIRDTLAPTPGFSATVDPTNVPTIAGTPTTDVPTTGVTSGTTDFPTEDVPVMPLPSDGPTSTASYSPTSEGTGGVTGVPTIAGPPGTDSPTGVTTVGPPSGLGPPLTDAPTSGATGGGTGVPTITGPPGSDSPTGVTTVGPPSGLGPPLTDAPTSGATGGGTGSPTIAGPPGTDSPTGVTTVGPPSGLGPPLTDAPTNGATDGATGVPTIAGPPGTDSPSGVTTVGPPSGLGPPLTDAPTSGATDGGTGVPTGSPGTGSPTGVTTVGPPSGLGPPLTDAPTSGATDGATGVPTTGGPPGTDSPTGVTTVGPPSGLGPPLTGSPTTGATGGVTGLPTIGGPIGTDSPTGVSTVGPPSGLGPPLTDTPTIGATGGTTSVPTGSPGTGSPTDITTVGPTTVAPSNPLTVSGLDTVVIESTMKFRLFDGIEPRRPTMEETQSLLDQTSRFYTNVLREAFPVKFYDLDVSFVGEEFDSDLDYSIEIDFNVNVLFESTSIDPGIPSAYDAFLAMNNADYLEYVTDYVSLSEPDGSIFREVQAAQYSSRQFTIAPTGSTMVTGSPTTGSTAGVTGVPTIGGPAGTDAPTGMTTFGPTESSDDTPSTSGPTESSDDGGGVPTPAPTICDNDEFHNVFVFGSSVARGTGATDLEGYAYLLGEYVEETYNQELKNEGIGGYTTSTTLPVLENVLGSLDYAPQVVIIGLSTANEGLLSTTTLEEGRAIAAQFEAGIETIVTTALEYGVETVIVGSVYPQNDYDTNQYTVLQEVFASMAVDVPSYSSGKAVVADFLTDLDDGVGHWIEGTYADAGHPNDEGHALMFESLKTTFLANVDLEAFASASACT